MCTAHCPFLILSKKTKLNSYIFVPDKMFIYTSCMHSHSEPVMELSIQHHCDMHSDWPVLLQGLILIG